MKQIFIAYASQDREHMHKLSEHLTQAGYKLVMNRKSGTTQNWQLEIVETIRSSHAVVAILSQRGAESPEVTYEWALALGAGVRVIPVVFRGVIIHPHLTILEQFDFGSYSDEDLLWQQFTRELQRMLGDESSPQAASRPPSPAKVIQLDTITSVLGSPDMRADEKLPNRTGFYLVVQHGSYPKEVYRLDDDSISLGRDDTNYIQINDSSVSRTHLRFVRSGNSYRVIDMASTNGTYMKGERIEMAELRPGNVLTIGDSITLTYRYVP